MNHIYRLVWSRVANSWVAVAETARGKGKTKSRAGKLAVKLTVAALSATAASFALPSFTYAANANDATVVGGQGAVKTAGNTTTITQGSQNLALDWTGLSTVAGEALVFVQPNAQAIALNRITGSSPSTLLGSLTANGQVYILNPNGVLFGAGAQVNVGGLVASTLTMDPADFMNGSRTFTKDPNATGTVENRGTLTAANGGYIALLSGTVRNEGTINTPSGTALLAAGDKVTLNINNGSLIGYSIDQGDLNALVENKQLIRADGGQVIMVAKALDKLSSAVINNTGIIQARTVQNQNGKILLLGDMDVGTVNVAGTLDASAPVGGDGGFIETSAAHVKVADGTVVTTVAVPGLGLTGSWLIDPTDFTVAASGGDMSGATLSNNLGTTNFEIQSTAGATSGSGDININDVVSWNAATTLTLSAQRNININQSITAANAAGKVSLKYGLGAANAGNTATYNVKAPINLQAGNNFSTQLGSDGALIQYQVITSLGSAGSATGTDLQGMNGNVSGHYVLGSNIDASATAGWNSGAGFVPVGTDPFDTPFNGLFDGLGHVINNLTINRPTTDYVGLFGFAEYGAIRNVGVVGGSITGRDYVGGLVGGNEASIRNSYTTASVSGASYVGGLIGFGTGTISNSYATGVVSGLGTYASVIGGLVGYGDGDITNSFATGNVSGLSATGGLVGINGDNGSISNSFATGNVSGSKYAGGLVGMSSGNIHTNISNSYASGNVSGSIGVGGLAGFNGSTISNSFAAGQVTGSSKVGGLVGINSNGTNTSGITALGTITASFWNTSSSGIGVGIGGGRSGAVTGINNADASKLSTFANAGWNIDATGGTGTIWRIYDGQSGPLLRSFLTQITVTGGAASKTYDGTTTTAGGAYTPSINGATLGGSMSYVTSKNAGSYSSAAGTLIGTGLFSGQQGYDIIYTGASVTINQANVTLSTSNVTKTYDGTTAAAGSAIVNAGTIFGSDTLSGGAFAFSDKNAGAGNKTVTASGVTINDGNGGNNYNVSYANNTASTINQANVTLSTSNVTKTYDGTTAAAGTAVASVGAIFTGDSLSGGSFAFTDKNAGTSNKTVTASGVTINDGNGGNNYNVTYANNTTSTINKADVTVSSSNVTKTYDGTTAAAGNAILTSGAIFTGDSLSGGSFAFTDKNAGSGNKSVTTSGATVGDGVNNSNYNVTYANNTTSTINKADVTLAASDVTKTYDGTTVATGTAVLSTGTIFSGDSISGGAFAFTDKNAGSGNKSVTTSGATVGDGVNNSNYNITYANNTTSTINKADVTLAASDVTKTYDGTTVATGTAVLSTGTIFSGDSISGGAFAFTDKNAGSGNKVVTASGATVGDGVNNNNYNITYANNTTSTINKADVTLAASDVTKTYDGTTAAAGTAVATIGSIFSGDNLSGGDFAFTDKNAGAGNKTVTAGGVTVNDGNGGNNYNVSYADNTTSTINKANLSVTASAADKVYDGLTTTGLTYTDNRIAGDILNFSGTADFADKNAGNGKAVTVGGIGMSGVDADNYNMSATAGNTSANITPASLTVAANADNKFYDGQAYTGNNGVTINGLVGGDTIADLLGTLNYGGSSQGATGIGNYVITPGGLNSGNYHISFIDGVLSIKALSQASAALGGTTLEQSYNGVRKTIADITDGEDQGNPAEKNGNAVTPPIVAANSKGSATPAPGQVTPRLSLAGCGMSMPAGGGC